MLTGEGHASGISKARTPDAASCNSLLARWAPVLITSVPLAMLLVVITTTRPDPDLWGHLVFGRDIAAAGQIPRTDTYSFASDRTWINHEWLAELLMHWSFNAGGVAGLILFKTLIVLLLVATVLHALQRHAPSPMLRHAVVWLAVFGTLTRAISVRPQVFSLLLFAALLHILTDVDRGRARRILWLPPLMALWANLHGGWVVGLGAVAVWAAFRVAGAKATAADRFRTVSCSIAALLATLVNPYGIGLWRFLFETVRVERADISDWGPMTLFPVPVMVPWVFFVAMSVWTVWKARTRPPLSYAVLILTLAVATARVNRFDGFFALSVLVLLAPQLAAMWRRPGTQELSRELRESSRTLLAVGATGAAALAAAGWGVYGNVKCIPTDTPWAPEQAAVTFIQANGLRGRMVTWFNWGEYAIWHFAPALQVSIDGRRETVYSQAWIERHSAFYRGGGDALTLPSDVNADYAWLPNDLPVVPLLIRAGWVPVFKGSVSTVLSRHPDRSYREVTTSLPEVVPTCFPE